MDFQLAESEDDSEVAQGPSRHSPHVSKACDRCRSRKIRCSGDSPSCKGCLRSKRKCCYTDGLDKRKMWVLDTFKTRLGFLSPHSRSRAWQEEKRAYEKRISELEQALQNRKIVTSDHSPADLDFIQSHQGSELDDDGDLEPFGVGQLTLAKNRSLQVDTDGTFYRPGRFAYPTVLSQPPPPHRVGMADMFSGGYNSDQRWFLPVIAPHNAPYLPHPLDPALHTQLLDLHFQYGISFAFHSLKDGFLAGMRSDCTRQQMYYSPLLHLACLAGGFRYLRIPDADQSSAYADRGSTWLSKARELMDLEVNEPTLGTIVGVVVVSHTCFGMGLDRIGNHCYAIAACLAQEFRLHQRCDEELRAIGLEPGSELDIGRRNVWGLIQNYSCLWSNYFGRLSLPFSVEANQRPPVRLAPGPASEDPIFSTVTEAFYYHCKLSKIGQMIVFCNHSWRTSLPKRVAFVKQLQAELFNWRQSLPPTLQWPQPKNVSTLMSPDIATLLTTYDSYVIELLRPYLTLPKDSDLVPDAMQVCIDLSDELIDLIRFVRDFHGVGLGQLCLQQSVSVGGTMVVMQASGLGNVSHDVTVKAQRQLMYIKRWLDEFAEIWPTVNHTVESLRRLEAEYCL